MRARRREAQPSGHQDLRLDLQEPGRPAAEGRTAGQLLEAAGCKGLAVGGARFSPKHANFIENARRRDDGRRAALIAEGRRRVRERFGVELEPEVQLLGDVELPVGRSVTRSDVGAGVLASARRLPSRCASRRASSRSCCAAVGWLGWSWLRDSSLVQVEHVEVSGLTTRDAPAIRRALRAGRRA